MVTVRASYSQMLICCLLLELSAGCAQPSSESAPPAGARGTEKSGVPSVSALTAQTASDAARVAQAHAIQEAVRVTGTRPEEIQVLSVEAREWPDSSLGCPRAGQLYAQVVSRGFEVRLRTGGALLAYHVSGEKAVLCS
jgi:hypothetical protein